MNTYRVIGTGALAACLALATGCSAAVESPSTTGGAARACPNSAAADALRSATAPYAADSLDLPALTHPNPLRHATVSYIASGLSFPFSQEVLAGVKSGTSAAGATVSVSDSGGDPAKAGSLIDQAVSGNARVILLQGTDPVAVSASIRNAKNHDIPLVSVAALNPGAVPAELQAIGVSAIAAAPSDVGTRQADFVAANSGCAAHVLFVGSSTFPTSNADEVQFTSRLARMCPDCKTSTLDSPIAQWPTQLGPQVNAVLLRNPDISYVVTVVDDMFTSVKPALQSLAGRQVKLVGNNAVAATMQVLKGGLSDPVAATVGTPLRWMGWAAVDQAQRVVAGEPAVAHEPVANRTFVHSNVKSLDLANPETWYGTFDYQRAYRTLWGIS
ncbi:sugar ABC transporter substrate-binding protein [Amycolatopsis rubida]|uniref:Sugar ABC transporter substrate-binding protein n=1 Tax=Amycolatopsis rubida TaxID=112413 RepID=A0ABX0CDG2_9PSEU|nr:MULTISPECIES: substrate-binding domain-containing protein [Amycolatopsis]MYW97995.1 substrate-binding domain-containing protein [Amycolatopsis rubida]NEC62980.1 sugar ABC transporter substrate-binding protein [Amycolatopsis rubida]OAP24480.1 D-ribose-binding periplasmic protein precursor [Amycolatopsis sp. M39]